MLHHRYIMLLTLLLACLNTFGQVRDVVIKDGAYYTTANMAADTVYNQNFLKDSVYIIVPRDTQIAHPNTESAAQLIIWKNGRPLYALPITQQDSISYLPGMQGGDTLRTIFSQQSATLPSYPKRPIIWQHRQVTITDSAQVLPLDSYQAIAQGDYASFIIPPTQIITDTRHILRVRDTIYKVQDIYDDPNDSIPAIDTIPIEPGRRIGVFSVAADKQVSFSQGNLQYTQSTDTWQFAREQYECIGEGNIKDGALADHIDLFGWSGKDSKVPYGVGSSGSNADYAGDFVDWGTNEICGDAPNIWRTLSIDEWKYLYHERKNADKLFALGTINGIAGMILLPDDWQLPEGATCQLPTEKGLLWDENYNGGGYINTNTTANHYQDNVYTLEQWQIMEDAGAVLLPTAGYRENTNFSTQSVNPPSDYVGSYATSTITDGNNYYFMRFIHREVRKYSHSLYRGRAVRLVHDTIVPTLEPKYVDLGLSVKWATFNVGASKPEDYGDYFAWGETEPKETYSWATYKWCDGTQNNMTKYNTTDGKTILEPADDAATANWGDKWRMPTKEEMQELFDKCTWTEETRNGINGYIVTGPNGNSIFLPRAGFYNYDDFGVSLQKPGHSVYYWTSTIYDSGSMNARDYINAWDLVMNGLWDDNRLMDNTRRLGLSIRPVYDDRPTLTVIPTPEDAKVSFHCSGYQWAGNSITVDKGKDVLYQVTNVDAGYLSQGDSIYKLTKDSVLYVTLRPFSDGNWVKVNKSEYTKQEGYYVSRNNGGFASHSIWNYYVLPVLPGETYRVRSIAGQHAALWIAASTAPYPATNTRPTKISCCANRGVAAYVADEVTIPDGAKYLIINSRNDKEMMVERKVPDPCMVVKVNDTLSINLMCVEGGTFMMGAMEGDTQANANEKPAHEVTLTYDYYIGQTEVTQALWKAVMGYNPSTMVGDNLPVNNVLWGEAQAFVYKLNQITGLSFDLPTEAEWEYAARGGKKSKGYLYAGSNNLDEVAWYNNNSGGVTHPVAQKMPNELGIYDMSGNVWEWCSDWLAPYTAEAQLNPTGPATGECHVYHGGGWTYGQNFCRSSHRRQTVSGYVQQALGLRVVLREKVEPQKHYRYGYTQEDWDAATSSWGHAGRGHAPADQSCIQGTMVYGIRLKVALGGSLNVYKVPSLLEKTEDHFELVATLTTTTTGVQDFDFAEPIYIAPNECLVFGKPSEEEPTLRPYWFSGNGNSLPDKAKGVAHYIGTEEASIGAPSGSLMVEFY